MINFVDAFKMTPRDGISLDTSRPSKDRWEGGAIRMTVDHLQLGIICGVCGKFHGCRYI